MAVQSISYIQLNDGLDPHPIDAMMVGNKSAAQIGELVTSINSNSTDGQYPSAKCIYEMIYGSSFPPLPQTLNNIWDGITIWAENIIWQ